MTNRLDLLIALNKEYVKLLKAYKNGDRNVSMTRLRRTALVLRQTTIEFEKRGIDND